MIHAISSQEQMYSRGRYGMGDSLDSGLPGFATLKKYLVKRLPLADANARFKYMLMMLINSEPHRLKLTRHGRWHVPFTGDLH